VRRLLLSVAAVLLCACGPTGASPEAAPIPSPAPVPTASPAEAPAPLPSPAGPVAAPLPAPVPPPPAAPPLQAATPAWVVGASPLPLRPDGFGEVLPTPEILRDRAMTAASLLPPPPGGAFRSTVEAISPAVRARMGHTWSPECPVALADLRYVTVSFRGFDGAAHTGELVVAASFADDVVGVLARLFAAEFPIEQMRLITDADLDAPATGDGNNTAAFICRPARGQTRWSQHAYGTAVDINPFHNPLVKRDLVVPELASSYADRSPTRPGMHAPGSQAVRAFSSIGWEWGGMWKSSKDYMHFSENGQ